MNDQITVRVTPEQLPLSCPTPAQALWNQHPRVFIPLSENGSARCPYCGTIYHLDGKPGGSH
jgi:uncharacterized Zn-finger protein